MMMTDSGRSIFANVGGKLVDVRVFPIQIREDCTVRVFGLPHDLSQAEAEKISRVIKALAQKGSDNA
jgi:hypothetical protein